MSIYSQSNLPSAAHVSPVHMASLVPQGSLGGMDVMDRTEIRDPREYLDRRELQDCREQREKLVSRDLPDKKESPGRLGQMASMELPFRRILRTGKSAHGKT